MKRSALAVVVLLVAVGVVAVLVLHRVPHVLARAQECSARVEGHTSSTLDPEQAQNAALIAAIAVRRGIPAHAATVAIATAMQESKLYNLASGDRDSIGLFQQRPSQGWGTAKQVADPAYATNAFYDALERLDNWRSVSVTEAAQAVQHSAYPSAYARHEPDARALASALTGYSPHAFTCRIDTPKDSSHPHQLRTELTSLFGVHPEVRGSRVEVPVPGSRIGWALAQYLLPQASRFGITHVAYDGRIWSTGDHSGWVAGGHATRQQVVVTTLSP